MLCNFGRVRLTTTNYLDYEVLTPTHTHTVITYWFGVLVLIENKIKGVSQLVGQLLPRLCADKRSKFRYFSSIRVR